MIDEMGIEGMLAKEERGGDEFRLLKENME